MNLTATYDPAAAAVALHVTDAPAHPTIYRADANGRAVVRLPGATYTAAGAGAWTVEDREHALAGPVRYVAEAGDPLDMAVADTAGLDAAPRNPVLTNPVDRALDLGVLQVAGLTGARTTNATVHPIIGRATPVVTHDVPSSRTGTLTLLVADHAEARRVEAATLGGPVLLLRQADHRGLDLYFTTTAAATVHAGGRYWTVELPYIETEPPAGTATAAPSSTWTFKTVADEHESFLDVFANYLSWDDLTERKAVQ